LKKNRRGGKESSLRESSESSKSGAASIHSNGGGNNNAAVAAPQPAMNPQLVAEIGTEELNYRTLMSTLLNLADVKVNIKKELKDWQNDFKAKYGREATVEDKMAINDRFIAYKMVRVHAYCGSLLYYHLFAFFCRYAPKYKKQRIW
jgi:hypothetical protein